MSQSNRSSLFSVSIMHVDPNCRPFSYHCFKWETSSALCLKKVVCTVFNFALYPPKWSYLKNLWLSIGNSMICSYIWHKYHEWYFEIVIQISRAVIGEWNLWQFGNITSGIYAKCHAQIMLLFVYTTTRKSFVIFTCRYFKLSWNTTALSQSNYRNFSCSSIIQEILSARSLMFTPSNALDGYLTWKL